MKKLLIFLFSTLPLLASGQEGSLQMLARPLPDSIMLRWAPTDYATWQLGNRYGYTVARYTIMRDSALLQDVEKALLTSNPLKPLELDAWEPLVQTGKYAAIAAQALYGKTFAVDAGEGFTPQSVTNKAKEQRQRFSFALHAADMSPETAKACGLWLTDTTAKENEQYLYRLYIHLPDSVKATVDTAFVYTGTLQYAPLPKPVEFSATFSDRLAMLGWNTFAQDNTYVAWETQRSENGGKVFAPLTGEPIMPVSKTGSTGQAFKFDTLPKNGKAYQYRLRGITPFGERGPWSEPVSGMGQEPVGAAPAIKSHDFSKNRVTLEWEFPQDKENTLTGFRILRSDNHKTGFQEIATNLKPTKRSFTDKKPLGTGYYKVVAYREGGDTEKKSYPYMVQLTDNTPPIQPQNLEGAVDSSGIVTLQWMPNPDEDIYGYRVFRSASGNNEFSQRTHRPVFDTFYVDTVNKKDLNASVFYKIVAIDQRQNQSEFSKVAELVKPDGIPPSIPVIKSTRATREGIVLEWVNSTSADVAKHVIYRFTKGDSAWTAIAEIPRKKAEERGTYTDGGCSVDRANQYKIVAMDKSGNLSQPSLSVAIKGLRDNRAEGLKKISKQVDREKGKLQLTWQLPEKAVRYIKIYRKSGGGNYALFTTIEGDKTSFLDYRLKLGRTYAYRVKLNYMDGTVSSFSNEIKVEF